MTSNIPINNDYVKTCARNKARFCLPARTELQSPTGAKNRQALARKKERAQQIKNSNLLALRSQTTTVLLLLLNTR